MENGNLFSCLTVTATVPVSFCECKPQPSMHLMTPLSRFPAYETELLSEGIYYFASAYYIGSENTNELPQLKLSDNALLVTQT